MCLGGSGLIFKCGCPDSYVFGPYIYQYAEAIGMSSEDAATYQFYSLYSVLGG